MRFKHTILKLVEQHIIEEDEFLTLFRINKNDLNQLKNGSRPSYNFINSIYAIAKENKNLFEALGHISLINELSIDVGNTSFFIEYNEGVQLSNWLIESDMIHFEYLTNSEEHRKLLYTFEEFLTLLHTNKYKKNFNNLSQFCDYHSNEEISVYSDIISQTKAYGIMIFGAIDLIGNKKRGHLFFINQKDREELFFL